MYFLKLRVKYKNLKHSLVKAYLFPFLNCYICLVFKIIGKYLLLKRIDIFIFIKKNVHQK